MIKRAILPERTSALCSTCLRRVEAAYVERDSAIFLDKLCPEHGPHSVLAASDPAYFTWARGLDRPAEYPLRFNTEIERGCPYDCGICPGHEQHSCVALVEITDACNLACPVCYADSSPARGPHKELSHIEFLLDSIVANEGEPAVVQISGGEPTIHPEFFAVLDAARKRPIQHLMVNTNGVKIAEGEEFAKRLASYMPGFEVYLQFDSLRSGALKNLRGADLKSVRLKAIERLNKLGVSTTLVVVVKKGLNDDELGELLDFALAQPCVRGVTFQPVQAEGRTRGYDPLTNRLTLTDVRTNIIEQHSLFNGDDIIPVPCHPDCIAMAYALKVEGKVIPLTRHVDLKTLIEHGGATIAYEHQSDLKKYVKKLFSASCSPASGAKHLFDLLCCLPKVETMGNLNYENLFRIIIMKFMDRHDMEIRSVKKACVHILHRDGRIIPFDTYNLFYRDGCEENLRRAITLTAGQQ